MRRCKQSHCPILSQHKLVQPISLILGYSLPTNSSMTGVETTILIPIATNLAAGVLTEVIKKAAGATSESSLVEISRYAIFGDLAPDLRLIEKELEIISSVLEIAQSIDAMHYDKNSFLLKWLKKVKEVACYADNLLDEIAYEKIRRKKHREANPSLVDKFITRSDTSFRFRMRIAGDIKKFSSLTAEIYKGAETTLHLTQLVGNDSTTSNQPSVHENLREIREVADTSNVMGRDADLKLVVESLCRQHDHPVLSVVPIVGRSGVGKTTLARMVYDNETVKEHFGTKTWIFVSDNFSLRRILDEMLQAITHESHRLTSISTMEEMLKEHVQKEKKGYLLVLDDVWNLDKKKWEVIRSVLVRITDSIGCSVLVTTQLSQVAEIMCDSHAHELNDLSDSDAWALFEDIAFARKTPEQSSELKDVGRSILSKCQGLPLAIKTMGSLLASMSDKSSWESIDKSEIWNLSLDQSKIMPWLLISFHHLPNTAIRQCFVHCSFSIEKGQTVQQSDLIQAWMAQGFIRSTSESDLGIEKDIGEKYVTYLVAYGLLQVFKVSDYMCLKMHDLIYDMARYISKDTIWISDKAHDLYTATNVEHIRINDEGSLVSVYSLPKNKALSKLRTLICTRVTLSINFGAQTKFLRDLRMIYCELVMVPISIGELKHLRYLSLRGNPFTRLPESVCKLFNLQMLDLAECYNLDGLPLGIEKLDNLREIVMSETNRTPNLFRLFMLYLIYGEDFGVVHSSKLPSVRILPRLRFAVEEGTEITNLKNMEFISGDVELSGLHLINCNDMEEQILRAKKGINKLFLKWGPLKLQEADGDDASNDEGVMNGLHPHSNLEEIHVDGFGGKRFSSWLIHMSNLKTIVLKSCNRCDQLPALGQLASLEKLDIDGMESLVVIGAEFYQNNEERASTSSNIRRGGILFPRLKSLYLRNMQKLREWVEPSGEYKKLFPKLYELEIRDCPLLSSAPVCFSSLSRLNTDNVTFFQPHAGISSVSLRGNNKSDLIPDLRSLSKIVELTLVNFSGQMSIPEWMNCLTGLMFLNIGGFNEELVELDGAAYIPKGLRYLQLDGWPKLKCIPSELQSLKQLTGLGISEFEELESLPEWLGNLSSLQFLHIEKCKDLKNLPSHEAIRRLTHLSHIEIRDCPILEKMCTNDEGKEWKYNEDDKVWRRDGRFH